MRLQPLDEFTAWLWTRKEGAFCPRRDGKGRVCGELLEWEGGEHVCCPAHGPVYEVTRAA